MPLSADLAKQYRPAKGIGEEFAHRIFGTVKLSKVKAELAEKLAEEGILIPIKKKR